MKYESMAGDTILYAAEQMVAMANENGCEVESDFNDIAVKAKPGDDPNAIAEYYRAESQRRYDAYRSSPEYQRNIKEAEERQRKQDAEFAALMAETAPEMQFADEAFYRKQVQVNSDPYGGRVISYASDWARLMEVAISKGETVEACAERLSRIADHDGITGFMYGAAVSTLARAWKYGDQLRRWHNLKTQIGHEGERANETGGTLNPALLSMEQQ